MGAKKTKKHLISHAVMRLSERYSMPVTAEDIEDINSRIKYGQADFIGHESNTHSRWVVDFDGQRLPVIYNRKLKCIATVLPEHAMDEWKRLYYF